MGKRVGPKRGSVATDPRVSNTGVELTPSRGIFPVFKDIYGDLYCECGGLLQPFHWYLISTDTTETTLYCLRCEDCTWIYTNHERLREICDEEMARIELCT